MDNYEESQCENLRKLDEIAERLGSEMSPTTRLYLGVDAAAIRVAKATSIRSAKASTTNRSSASTDLNAAFHNMVRVANEHGARISAVAKAVAKKVRETSIQTQPHNQTINQTNAQESRPGTGKGKGNYQTPTLSPTEAFLKQPIKHTMKLHN